MARYASITARRRNAAPLLLLTSIVVALIIYVTMLNHPLIRPGRVLTVHNVQVAGAPTWRTIWMASTPPDLSAEAAYRPVAALLLRVQWLLWGESPSSFHGFSLLLFLATLVTYLLLTGRLLTRPVGRIAAVLLLTVHPMAGQSVLGVAGQSALLALLGMMLASLAMLGWRRGEWSLSLATPVIAVCQAVAIGSHEMGWLMPLWLAAAAFVTPAAPETDAGQSPRRRRGLTPEEAEAQRRPERKRAASVYSVAAAVVLIPLAVLRYLALDGLLPGGDARPAIEGSMLLHAPSVVLFYVLRLIWPVAPSLVHAESTSALPPMVLGWLFLIGAIAAIVFLYRRDRLASLACVWILLPLLALSQVIPLSIFVSEGPLVFALPGFGLLVGSLVQRVAGPDAFFPPAGVRGRAIAGAVLVVVLALAVQSWQRAREWSGDTRLWAAEVERHPDLAEPYIELMIARFNEGDVDAALEAADAARDRARPAELDRLAHHLTLIYAESNRYNALTALLNGELEADRRHGRDHLNTLAALARQQELTELSEELYRKQIEQYPDDFTANFEVGKLEYQRGNLEQALEMIIRAAGNAPREWRPAAYTQLAELYAEAGLIDAAVQQLLVALEINPRLFVPYVRLAQIFWGRKDYARAEQMLAAALSNADVSSFVDVATIGMSMFEEQGRAAEGLQWLRRLSRQYPNDARMQIYVAATLVDYRDYQGARDIYNRLRGVTDPELQARVLVGLGKIALDVDGDREQARLMAARAVQLDPSNRPARQLLQALEGGSSGGQSSGVLPGGSLELQ